MTWPFGDLRPGSASLIMADPPWRFENWSARGEGKNAVKHYPCMTAGEIAALPVGELAAVDSCLFLWTTWPVLPVALEIMEAWGFSYSTGGAWHKRTVNGHTAYGTGYRVRSACEPFLLGFRGSPAHSHAHRNLIEGQIREHSRKPEEAYTWCESYMPDAHKVELFARHRRFGWSWWGNECA